MTTAKTFTQTELDTVVENRLHKLQRSMMAAHKRQIADLVQERDRLRSERDHLRTAFEHRQPLGARVAAWLRGSRT